MAHDIKGNAHRIIAILRICICYPSEGVADGISKPQPESHAQCGRRKSIIMAGVIWTASQFEPVKPAEP
ncbi:hypothetical protein KPH14_008315 [Odynerus spinipes]|uniref:Uncharacterized protein n=1 Tax=Odynerus spinipes TaxID=1348599 RepID=A0AAD9R939_9HYME|nr:hypothetical protein KPH14_008315 [Odynerus spinipes]